MTMLGESRRFRARVKWFAQEWMDFECPRGSDPFEVADRLAQDTEFPTMDVEITAIEEIKEYSRGAKD